MATFIVQRFTVWALLVLVILALPFMSAKPTFAASSGTCGTDCSLSASPPTGGPNATYYLSTSSGPESSPTTVFLAVITPNGQTYVCEDITSCSNYTLPPSGDCAVPFGGGAANSMGCGNPSDSGAWVDQTSPQNLTQLETTCNSGAHAGTSGTSGTGSTSETGTYTAITCLLTGQLETPAYAVTTWTVEVYGTTTQTVTSISASTTTTTSTTTLTSTEPTTTATSTTTTTSTTTLPASTVTSTATETTTLTSPTVTTTTTQSDTVTTTQTTTSTTTVTATLYTTTEFTTTTETVPTTTTVTSTTTFTVTVTSTQTVTATSTQTSTATSTQKTTTTSTAQPPSLTVESVNQNGQAITGYYTVLRNSGGGEVGTGYTPDTFTGLAQGASYRVELDSYGGCTFTKWSDGVTTDPRTFTASGALTLVGVYDCGSGAAPRAAVGAHPQQGGFLPLAGLAFIPGLLASSSALAMTAFIRVRSKKAA